MTLLVVRNRFVTRKECSLVCLMKFYTPIQISQKNRIFPDICSQNLELTSASHVPPTKFFLCYTIRKSENIAQHHTNNSAFHNITHINFGIISSRIVFLPQNLFFLHHFFFEDFLKKNIYQKKLRKFLNFFGRFISQS